MKAMGREEYEQKRALLAHTDTEKPPYEEYLELVAHYGSGAHHAEARAFMKQMEEAAAEAAATEEGSE